MNLSAKTFLLYILILLPGLPFAGEAFAQTDVYLRVYTKTFQRMEIDLYNFEGEYGPKTTEMIDLINDVLSNDLWMSGYFKVNKKSGVPQNNRNGKKVDTRGSNGALAQVSGSFSVANNRISIQPHLIDNASGRTIIKLEYTNKIENGRYLIHKIADDIVYSLTGEKGMARSKVAFVTEQSNGVKEISVMDYDGHNRTTLTSDKSINLSPAWSPDGTRICYTSYKTGNPDLFVFNLRTNSQIRLSKQKGLNTAPAWSPDGSKIALTLSKDGNAEIYIFEVEKKKIRRLTYNRAIDSSPTWSPSKRELAFTSDRSGSPQIYIMDTDGVNVRRLTFAGGYNDSPSWSPRGDKIAFVSRTQSGFDIYTIDVTGENQMRLTDSSGSNEDPSWSPNGFSLIFSSTRSGNKRVYSMFWDGSDQKSLTSGGTNYSPAWSAQLK